jgi:hypothetical protein
LADATEDRVEIVLPIGVFVIGVGDFDVAFDLVAYVDVDVVFVVVPSFKGGNSMYEEVDGDLRGLPDVAAADAVDVRGAGCFRLLDVLNG